MIGYLKGKIISAKPTQVIIDVNGVGYEVAISIAAFEELQGKEIVELFIHTHVREDAIALFGFTNVADKEIFELLISVNGIGPKLALGIQSGIKTDDLKTAIQISDVSRLVAAPGVGKKIAERLVLELRGKMDSVTSSKTDGQYTVRGEGIAALLSLGYNQKSAEKVVREALEEEPAITIENLLRVCLKKLSS
jgi:holliday junction DNA helicase RuvA